jgi:hypothetical protein
MATCLVQTRLLPGLLEDVPGRELPDLPGPLCPQRSLLEFGRQQIGQ